MTLFAQISLGTLMLGVSSILHVFVLLSSMPLLSRVAKWPLISQGTPRIVALVGFMVVAILLSHGLQIWLWAVVWIGFDAFSNMQEALYFSAVTYTTLGYGDIVLGPEIRLFSTFGAVCGLLGFGVSTAFLVGLLTRILPDDLSK